MIEEQARVVAVADGSAWVEVRRRSACGSCSAAGGCGTGALAGLLGERAQRLQVRDDLGLRVGEQVVIGIPDAALTRASLAAYLLPLLALIAAALLAEAAGAGEGTTALAGLLGLGAGLWLAGRLTGGPLGRERYRPRLLRRAATPLLFATAPIGQ
jgi:sigma-E factor negative regulatory protein RseC